MSKKQRSVARSSRESEHIAQATYATQGQWAAQVLRDLGMPEYIGETGPTVDIETYRIGSKLGLGPDQF
jgi:hypothetical protein